MAPDIEDIYAQLCDYVEGDLDAEGRTRIEAHLAANPHHRALLQELLGARNVLRELPRAAAPADLADALQAQLERTALIGEGADEEAVIFRIARWPQLLTVAAIVMLAAGLGVVVYSILPGPTADLAVLTGGAESVAPSAPGVVDAAPHDGLGERPKKAGVTELTGTAAGERFAGKAADAPGAPPRADKMGRPETTRMERAAADARARGISGAESLTLADRSNFETKDGSGGGEKMKRLDRDAPPLAAAPAPGDPGAERAPKAAAPTMPFPAGTPSASKGAGAPNDAGALAQGEREAAELQKALDAAARAKQSVNDLVRDTRPPVESAGIKVLKLAQAVAGDDDHSLDGKQADAILNSTYWVVIDTPNLRKTDTKALGYLNDNRLAYQTVERGAEPDAVATSGSDRGEQNGQGNGGLYAQGVDGARFGGGRRASKIVDDDGIDGGRGHAARGATALAEEKTGPRVAGGARGGRAGQPHDYGRDETRSEAAGGPAAGAASGTQARGAFAGTSGAGGPTDPPHPSGPTAMLPVRPAPRSEGAAGAKRDGTKPAADERGGRTLNLSTALAERISPQGPYPTSEPNAQLQQSASKKGVADATNDALGREQNGSPRAGNGGNFRAYVVRMNYEQANELAARIAEPGVRSAVVYNSNLATNQLGVDGEHAAGLNGANAPAQEAAPGGLDSPGTVKSPSNIVSADQVLSKAPAAPESARPPLATPQGGVESGMTLKFQDAQAERLKAAAKEAEGLQNRATSSAAAPAKDADQVSPRIVGAKPANDGPGSRREGFPGLSDPRRVARAPAGPSAAPSPVTAGQRPLAKNRPNIQGNDSAVFDKAPYSLGQAEEGAVAPMTRPAQQVAQTLQSKVSQFPPELNQQRGQQAAQQLNQSQAWTLPGAQTAGAGQGAYSGGNAAGNGANAAADGLVDVVILVQDDAAAPASLAPLPPAEAGNAYNLNNAATSPTAAPFVPRADPASNAAPANNNDYSPSPAGQYRDGARENPRGGSPAYGPGRTERAAPAK